MKCLVMWHVKEFAGNIRKQMPLRWNGNFGSGSLSLVEDDERELLVD